MPEAGVKRKEYSVDSNNIAKPDSKKSKIESDEAAEAQIKSADTQLTDEPSADKPKKKSKKNRLLAKYAALEKQNEAEAEAEAEEHPAGTDKSDDDEFKEDEMDPDVDEEDGDFSDDDNESISAEDVDEDEVELSEPEVEPGSKRRRPRVDYAKVLAEMEAEEEARRTK